METCALSLRTIMLDVQLIYLINRVSLLIVLSVGTVRSMEQSLPRPVSGDLSAIAWQGNKVLVGSKTKKSLSIYEPKNNRLDLQATLRTSSPVVKIATSPAQNAIALGLKNGLIEIYSCKDGAFEDSQHISTTKREIHELRWIGDSAALLVYFKDREPDIAGTDTHYAHTSVLHVFDTTQGSLIKEFTLPHHILHVEPAPSGTSVAIVTDLHNRREDPLCLDEKIVRQELQLYSLNTTLSTEAVMPHPYKPESSIRALSWSPDSAMVAALLDDGSLLLFNPQGALTRQLLLANCQRFTGKIDWSSVTNHLAIPASLDTVEIYAPSESEDIIETIILEDYLTKVDPQKPLFATRTLWSPHTAELLILCHDLGDGACSSHKKLIKVKIADRKKKQRKLVGQLNESK